MQGRRGSAPSSGNAPLCKLILGVALFIGAEARADTRVFFIPGNFPATCHEELPSQGTAPAAPGCRQSTPFCDRELPGLHLARQALNLGSCEASSSTEGVPGIDVVVLVDDRDLGSVLSALLGDSLRQIDNETAVVPSRTPAGRSPQAMIVGERAYARAGSDDEWRAQIRGVAGNAPVVPDAQAETETSEDEETETERGESQETEAGPTDPTRAADSAPSDIAALVARARERCHVPEGGFTIGRQRADFTRGGGILVEQIMDRAAQDPEASRRQVNRSLRAFEEDTSVRGSDIPVDLSFSVAKASREGGPGMVFSTATTQVVSGGRDTHARGAAGFDYLWDIRAWVPGHAQRLRRVPSDDPDLHHSNRHPAWIARRDLFIAGIAYARFSESSFRDKIERIFSDLGDDARGRLLTSLSLDAKRAWVQSNFGRPGWTNRALEYIKRQAAEGSLPVDLNVILTDQGLIEGRHVQGSERTARFSIGRARVTACEAWMLDELGFPARYSG